MSYLRDPPSGPNTLPAGCGRQIQWDPGAGPAARPGLAGCSWRADPGGRGWSDLPHSQEAGRTFRRLLWRPRWVLGLPLRSGPFSIPVLPATAVNTPRRTPRSASSWGGPGLSAHPASSPPCRKLTVKGRLPHTLPVSS